jgi:hypothetical protein
MGFAAFSTGGEEVFFAESLFLKEKPASSGRKNGVLLSMEKHAVSSVFSARNRQPARRKASRRSLPRPHASRAATEKV